MNVQDEFMRITQLLENNQHFWRPVPFKESKPSWVETHHTLAQFLSSLSDSQVRHYAQNINELAEDLQEFVDDAREVIEIGSRIPKLSVCSEIVQHDFRHFKQGVKERKWQQVCAMVERLNFRDLSLVEWCSGKGYLAQLFAKLNRQNVSCIERDLALCHSGKAHANKFGIEAKFHQCDVLTDDVTHIIGNESALVALHACGQLHVKLMEVSASQKIPYLAIAPCCYHLYSSDHPEPVSNKGKNSAFRLSISDIRLSLEELVTGSPAELKKHQKLQKVRLAFDEFCREELGHTQYTSTPALRQSFAKLEAKALFLHIAQMKAIVLNKDEIDIDHWMGQGEKRHKLYLRYNLIRYLFRRLIELWLVMDRALYLEESGYRVKLGEFCDKALSPRNIMIIAEQ